jgi:3-hydroxyisobutyrate dehydrogenase-like beta-hydroxyacid dehydrogenase
VKIGFVGLGQMGSAIASNLIGAGHELVVWNRSADKAEALIARGARLATTPAEAASGEIVISMLADDRAVERVTFGEQGILSAAARPIHVSMSTISTDLADRLTAGQSGAYVSAPVFGRPAAAEAAKLFILAAGPSGALDACEPVFSAIGQRVFRIGERPSQANLVKLCGNFMIMAAIEAMAEAMTLAEKGNVSGAQLVEVLTGTLFSAPVYQTYGEILAEERFRPAGFAAPLGLKDMHLVASAAHALRTPMPVLSVLRDQLLSVIAQEGEEIDWSGVALAVRRNAGLQAGGAL